MVGHTKHMFVDIRKYFRLTSRVGILYSIERVWIYIYISFVIIEDIDDIKYNIKSITIIQIQREKCHIHL